MKLLFNFLLMILVLLHQIPTGAVTTSAEACNCDSPTQVHKSESLFDVFKKIELKYCDFEAIRNSPKNVNKQTVSVLVQLGFIDESSEEGTQPYISYDHLIIKGIVSFLNSQGCDFSIVHHDENNHSIFLEKKIKNTISNEDQTISIEFKNASNKGHYDKKISDARVLDLKTSLQSYDYFIYIGHSRFGKGIDLYPKKMNSQNKVPIYTDKWVKSLPRNLQGIGVLACDPVKHSQKQGSAKAAQELGLQFLHSDEGVFYFQNSIKAFMKIMNQFR